MKKSEANDGLPTSEEVDRRLRVVAELREVCLSLGRSRPRVKKVDEQKGADIEPRLEFAMAAWVKAGIVRKP